MVITLEEIAQKLNCELLFPKNSDESSIRKKTVRMMGAIDTAKPDEITFLTNPEYEKFLSSTQALAVIVGKKYDDVSVAQLLHKNPYYAFAKAAQIFVPKKKFSGEVSAQASVGKNVKLGKNVTIFPFAIICDYAEIGDDAVIYSGVHIGEGAKVGKQSEIRANTVIEDRCIVGDRVLIHGNTTVGSDGFGFAPGENDIAKIPQVGIVRIENDVEIGACTSIDRAAMGETVIGEGSKLDSAVHIAHGVRIGKNSMVCGGTCIAGSTKVGNWVVIAGQVAVSNGLEIGDRITVGGRAGVTKSLKEPGEYQGFPIMPAREWRREIVNIRRIEDFGKRIKQLETKIKELET